MDGRGDDVRRRLVGQLDDVLAEVGLDDLDAGGFEGAVEVHLLGGHRLRLDDEAHAFGPGDADDRPADLFGPGGPVHGHAQRFELGLEPVEPAVEVGEHLPADPGRLPAQLDEGRVGAGHLAAQAQLGRHVAERPLQLGVGDGRSGPVGQPRVAGQGRLHDSPSARSSATWMGSGPLPVRRRRPARWRRQPESQATR